MSRVRILVGTRTSAFTGEGGMGEVYRVWKTE